MSVITVLHGQPTPEELAAAVAVLGARAAAAAAGVEGAGEVSAWADLSRRLHRLPQPGPHAWRTSAWAR